MSPSCTPTTTSAPSRASGPSLRSGLSLGAGLVLGAVLLTGCLPSDAGRASLSAATPAAAPAAPLARTAPAGEGVVVTRVVDGDTLEVTGGRRIRVLGIDSCETGTPGGARATAAAVGFALGRPVTLGREGRVDRDRYGRELRYVATPQGDLGELMVPADHTAVYTGRNDASPAVQARLRALDRGGRSCGTPTTSTTTRPAGVPAPAPGTTVPRPPTSAPRVAPPRPTAAPAPSGGGYANCSAARAAGAAPLYRGGPGYSSKLDRDNDGVACE